MNIEWMNWLALFKGITLGFTAGIAPGPLTILVITQTLRHNWKEGVKVAIAPLLTDFPIIFLSYGVLSRFSQVNYLIAMVSFVGALFLIKMAMENWNALPPNLDYTHENPESIRKGILTNLLNPHPYLFWLTIGTPILLSSGTNPMISGALFIFGMFALMVGIKVVVAIIAKQSSSLLKGPQYVHCLRFSSLILAFFAIHFVIEGIQRLVGQL